jgi:hypothetical protein
MKMSESVAAAEQRRIAASGRLRHDRRSIIGF